MAEVDGRLHDGGAMRFGVSLAPLPASTSREDWLAYVRAVEAAGADAIRVGDVTSRNLEMYVQLGMLAAVSQSARLMSTVTNPVTRHPAVVAAAWGSLHHMTGGRAVLGVGTGNSALRNLGRGPARLEAVREHVRVIRELADCGVSWYDGARCEVPWLPEVLDGGKLSIFVAAEGRRGLELAGEIADGVIVGGGVDPTRSAQAMEWMRNGAARAARTIDDVETWWSADIAIVHDRDSALEHALNTLAALASSGPRPAPDDTSLPARRWAEFFERYDYAGHNIRNGALLQELNLVDSVAQKFLVIGSEQEVRSELAVLERRGIENLAVPGMLKGPFGVLEDLAAVSVSRPLADGSEGLHTSTVAPSADFTPEVAAPSASTCRGPIEGTT